MDTNAETRRRPQRTTAVLIVVAVAILLAAFVAMMQSATHERTRRNEQAWLLERLDVLVPPDSHDNDLLADRIQVTSPDILGIAEPVWIYRAFRNGTPVAAIVQTVAPDGYHGPIELLVAIAHDGTLLGVQVVRHSETAGLGDQFENRRTDWLDAFRGKSLADPPQQRWSVRPDGGDFDAFTGATITPRAIVKATRRALEYYGSQRDRLFATEAGK
ncbi:MAG TPA: electron transport complex subunit RsxG [Povalibacter sp.]|uniref:electron transport complex subunit RsxG n=1 Tax=Povalibacter sp. TaxID=1962978 RepID=UPI002C576034|nr:electron transport complex subunit RsxG [Povalibacter sp.]HMN43483.1 electron transport complex subunit RsxG [Povalibacter sp.]